MNKKSKFLILLLAILLTFVSCGDEVKSDDSSSIVSQEQTLRKFSKNSPLKNPSSQQIVNVLKTNYPDQELLLDNISESLNIDSNTNIYSIVEFFDSNENLIAYELYYFVSNLKHSLFLISDSGTFEKVFELKEVLPRMLWKC